MSPSPVIILDDPPAGYTYTQRKGWRERAKLRLASRSWQWLIIALVIADACLVATDIILASVYCGDKHPPHDVEVTETCLRYGSICILSFFVLEWLVELAALILSVLMAGVLDTFTNNGYQITDWGAHLHRNHLHAYVHGFHRWVRTPLHIIDLVIVCVSLALEITALAIEEAAVELGGLLVVFRLWRVVRVMHAVGEVEHHTHKELHTDLEMANARLQNINAAHHRIIKELHHEYTQRITALVDKNGSALASASTAPSLDEMLRLVSMRSDQLRRSVTLHRQSLQHRASGAALPGAFEPGDGGTIQK